MFGMHRKELKRLIIFEIREGVLNLNEGKGSHFGQRKMLQWSCEVFLLNVRTYFRQILILIKW